VAKKPPAAEAPLSRTDERWLAEWSDHIHTGEQAMETIGLESSAVRSLLARGAAKLNYPFFFWDCDHGYRALGNLDVTRLGNELERVGTELGDPDLTSPVAALKAIQQIDVSRITGRSRANAVYCLSNFYIYFESDLVRQIFENIAQFYEAAQDALRPVHFLQVPYTKLGIRGVELVRPWILPLPYGRPTEEDLLNWQVPELIERIRQEELAFPIDDDGRRALATAALGLTRSRAHAVLWYAARVCQADPVAMPAEVSRLTAAELAAAGTMQVVPPEQIVPPEHLGGIDRAIARLNEAAITFTHEAKAQRLDPAQGLWLCGVQGSGKSTCATAAAVIFERQTKRPWRQVRVRTSAFYGDHVGDTEAAWYDFEDRIAAFGECIVMLDEFDKAFGDVTNSSGDSGVRRGLFGMWLGWMSNPARRCYVIIAMNDPSGIPPEALRVGRFDAGFFFDLPQEHVRVEIAQIHFGKRLATLAKVRPDFALSGTLADIGFTPAQWDELGAKTENYLPSDIEGIVKSAQQVAFRNRGIAVPTFAETIGVIDARAAAIDATPEARAARKDFLDRVAALRKRCQAQGAEAVHLPPSAPAKANGNRNRAGRALKLGKINGDSDHGESGA
jgi:hypothetical protein